jgi:Putative Ig domain
MNLFLPSYQIRLCRLLIAMALAVFVVLPRGQAAPVILPNSATEKNAQKSIPVSPVTNAPPAANANTAGAPVTTKPAIATVTTAIAKMPVVAVNDSYTSLRSTLVNQKYENNLATANGNDQSKYSLTVGALPDGLTLEASGRLVGTPSKAAVYRFTVKVADTLDSSKIVYQSYRLNVYLPQTKPPPKKDEATKPEVPWERRTIPAEDATRSFKDAMATKMIVHMLTEKDIKELSAPPKPADLPPETIDEPSKGGDDVSLSPADKKVLEEEKAIEDHKKQRLEVLLKMKDTEYPTEELFIRALNSRVREAVNALIPAPVALNAARTESAGAKPTGASKAPTSKSISAPVVARSGADKPAASGEVVTAESLIKLILPDDARMEIVAKARKEHFFEKPTQDIAWDGSGCGCVKDSLQKQIYGFYPFWMAESGDPQTPDKPAADKSDPKSKDVKKPVPQPVNFSLLTRISYAAVPFDNDGSLITPMHWNDIDESAQFVREARKHGTKLDLVLYRSNWNALLNNDAKVNQVIANLPTNVLSRVEHRLTDWRSRAKSLASFIEPAPTMGDGLTIYFDEVEKTDPDKFAKFFDRFMLSIIDKMRDESRVHKRRGYVLNVVIPDYLLNKIPAYEFRKLFGYLVKAEGLTIEDGRIKQNDEDVEKTNKIFLRYLILLSEPTTDSKKALRLMTESSQETALKGSNRDFFLTSLVPVISYGGVDARQFKDDLIYFNRNFGGVGLWRMPLRLPDPNPGAQTYQMIDEVFSSSKESAFTTKICTVVCTNRWLFRFGMAIAFALGIAAWGVRILSCRKWVQSRQYFWWLMAGGILTALPLIAMLNCDPYLYMLWEKIWTVRSIGLIAALLAGFSVWQARKIKPRKP